MLNDDTLVGRLLNRREILEMLGLSGAGMLALGLPADALQGVLPACVVRPAEVEGALFVDEQLQRSDIRSDPASGLVKAGALLELTFTVSRAGTNGSTALAGAHVEVWHCDAVGVYSDANDRSLNTIGQRFLRGHQLTDATGQARFTTIYPGWYPGRAVHVNFKIRTSPSEAHGHEFSSQLYFDDDLTDRIHLLQPYASRVSNRLRNHTDEMYLQGGRQLTLTVSETARNLAASFEIGLQI
jgi:protocatechuate 3,4-dioxygenase beta subunit